MTSETRSDATRLILSKVLRDRLAAADRDFRANVTSFDLPGVRDIGVIGDEQIGSVVLTKGTERARVYDEAAYLAWVEEHHPQMVRRSVSATFTAGLVKRAQATGEVPPGVDIGQGDPTLTVRPSDDAAEVIGQALADGRLTWAEVATAAIEGGQ